VTTGNTIGKAVRNAWALTLGDGIEQAEPTPSTVVYDGHHRTLRRYDRAMSATGNPVLLVPPLAVSISCYDLRPGQSLARHLLDLGRQAYVIDYGDITFADRRLGFEEWVDDIIPTAIRRVSSEHGGADVHLVSWSLGGTIGYLTAAAHPELPIASLTTIGTPCDYSRIPGTAVARRLRRVTGETVMNLPAATFGGVPRHLVRLSYRAMALQREVTKPWFIAANLTRTESLARMESIDRFMGEMPGYPGRLYLQISSRLVFRNELAGGVVHLNKGQAINLADLKPRVLVIGSRTDTIAPAPAVQAVTKVLAGAESVRYVEVDGSHLGMLAGPEAATTTWPVIAEFLRSA
jgi:polyhydroxyalkanoate synthase